MLSPSPDAPAGYGVSVVRDRSRLADTQSPMPAYGWNYGMPARPEVLTSGPTGPLLWHAFRRRLWLAIGLAIPLAILLAGLIAWLMPVESRSSALLRVQNERPSVMLAEQKDEDFDAYKRNQQALIRNRFIITAALRQPGIAQLPTISRHGGNSVQWLSEELQVDFPGKAEYMEVGLSGDRPSDLPKIVNAVTSAYLEEVTRSERERQTQRKNALDEAYRRNVDQIQRKQGAIHQAAKDLGTAEDSTTKILLQRKLQELDALGDQRVELSKSLNEVTIKIAILKAMQDNPDHASSGVSAADSAIASDRQVQTLEASLSDLDRRIDEAKRTLRQPNDRRILNLQSQRELVEDSLKQRRAELASQSEGFVQTDPTGRAANLAAFELEKSLLTQQLDALIQKMADQQLSLSKLDTFSAELATQRAEVEQLQALNRSIGEDLKIVETEMNAPPRITLLQPAEEPTDNNRMTKYVLMGLASMFGLCIAVGGVTFAEFRRRRLNAAADVSQGLGLKLLGTLPSLSAWRPGRSGTLQAMMNESVDGVRTTLLHLASSGSHVVVVTSAAEAEGKTTLATQLAASLARLGIKTLYVDGDLRVPGGHAVFARENSRGFSEVLRGEATSEEVIQPTSTDRLFLMTAGSCDAASLHGLARPATAELFEKLKQDFGFVIVDSPPVLSVPDALLLGQIADGVILATLRDASSLNEVYESMERMRSVGINLLGAVVNGVQDHARKYGHLAIG